MNFRTVRNAAFVLQLTLVQTALARASHVWENAFTACGLEAAKLIVRENRTRCGAATVYGASANCLLVAQAAQTNQTRVTVLRFMGFNSSAVVQAAASVNRVMRDGGLQPSKWTLLEVPKAEAAIKADVTTGGAYHAYFLTAQQIGDLMEYGIPQDLSSLVGHDTALQWSTFLRFFRVSAALYDGRVMSIPTQGFMNLMYYRRDLFAAAGLQPPRTWEEAIAAARHFNGTDLNGDGNTNDFGICLWMPRTCPPLGLPLTSILASLVQARGHASGMFFHPITGTPVMKTRAWLHALEIGAQLSKYAPVPAANLTAGLDCAYFPDFSEGRCAMAITGPVQFKKDSVTTTTSRVRGLIGAVPMPGSSVVLDWESDTLVPCDATRCPYATRHVINDSSSGEAPTQTKTTSTNNNAGSPSGSSTGGNLGGTSQPSVLVNVAPFGGTAAFTAVINNKYSAEEQLATYYMLTQAVSLDRSWDLVASPRNSGAPTRMQHFDPNNLDKWLAFGYHPDDLSQFLDATYASFSSENVAVDMRSVGSTNLSRALWLAADMIASQHAPPNQAAATSWQAYDRALNGSNVAAIQRAYFQSINYQQPEEPADPTDQAQEPQHDGRQATLTAALASALAGAAVLAVMAALMLWLSRRHRHWLQRRLGHITAPVAGPQTTLCVTDIQDSTTLWERLSAPVMDSALRLHHVCLRRCATACEGYESATEGDSFILAFHSPQHALLFCLRAQEELLLLDWPQELLQEALCRPISLPCLPPYPQFGGRSSPQHSILTVPFRRTAKVHSRPLSLHLRPDDEAHGSRRIHANLMCSNDHPGSSGHAASATAVCSVRTERQDAPDKAHAQGTSTSQCCPGPETCACLQPLCLASPQLATPFDRGPATDAVRRELSLTERGFSIRDALADTDQVGGADLAADTGELVATGPFSACCDSFTTQPSPTHRAHQRLASVPTSSDSCRPASALCRPSSAGVASLAQRASVSLQPSGTDVIKRTACRKTPMLLGSSPQTGMPTCRSAMLLPVPAAAALLPPQPVPSTSVGPQQVVASPAACVTVGSLLKSLFSSRDALANCSEAHLRRLDQPDLIPHLLDSRQGAVLQFELSVPTASPGAAMARSAGLRAGSSSPVEPGQPTNRRGLESATSQRSSRNGSMATAVTTQTLPEDTVMVQPTQGFTMECLSGANELGQSQPMNMTGADTEVAPERNPRENSRLPFSWSGLDRGDGPGGPQQDPRLQPESSHPNGHGLRPAPSMLFRGLRVRMGCASGVGSESEVSYNSRMARTIYTGRSIAAAKAVANAAQGGMVLLGEAMQALLTEGLVQGGQHGYGIWPSRAWKEQLQTTLLLDPPNCAPVISSSRRDERAKEQDAQQQGTSVNCKGVTDWSKPQPVVLWYSGCAVLDATLPSMEIYQAATPGQVARWAALPAPTARIVETPLAYGIQAAPLGCVALAVVAVSSASDIAALSDGDNHDVWRDCALQLWHEAARLCQLHGGFLATRRAAVVGLHREVMAAGGGHGVKGGGGEQLVLTAVFADPTEAVVWSAGLIARCLRLPWPAALLQSEFGEPLSLDSLAPPGSSLQLSGTAAATASATHQPAQSSAPRSRVDPATPSRATRRQGLGGSGSGSYGSSSVGSGTPFASAGIQTGSKPGRHVRGNMLPRPSGMGHHSGASPFGVEAAASMPYTQWLARSSNVPSPVPNSEAGSIAPSPISYPSHPGSCETANVRRETPNRPGRSMLQVRSTSRDGRTGSGSDIRAGERTWRYACLPGYSSVPRGLQDRARLGMLSSKADWVAGSEVEACAAGSWPEGEQAPSLGPAELEPRFAPPRPPPTQRQSEPQLESMYLPEFCCLEYPPLLRPHQVEAEAQVERQPESIQHQHQQQQQVQGLQRVAFAALERHLPPVDAEAPRESSCIEGVLRTQLATTPSVEQPLEELARSCDGRLVTDTTSLVTTGLPALGPVSASRLAGPSVCSSFAAKPEAGKEIEASDPKPPAGAVPTQCYSLGDTSANRNDWRLRVVDMFRAAAAVDDAPVDRGATPSAPATLSSRRTYGPTVTASPPGGRQAGASPMMRTMTSRSMRSLKHTVRCDAPPVGLPSCLNPEPHGPQLLAAGSLDTILARGPRLRAGVELGVVALEVQCSTGSPRYVGAAASGALVLALSAPVSRVQVSRCVAAEVQAGAGVEAIRAAEAELAEEEQAAAGAAALRQSLDINPRSPASADSRAESSSRHSGKANGLDGNPVRGSNCGTGVLNVRSVSTSEERGQQQCQEATPSPNVQHCDRSEAQVLSCASGAIATDANTPLLNRIVVREAVAGVSPHGQDQGQPCSMPLSKRLGCRVRNR